MNVFYFDVGQELKDEFEECFNDNNTDEVCKFKFLRKFIMFVENDVSSFNHLILLENPLANKNRYDFINKSIHKVKVFLESILKHKTEPGKRKIVGVASCYKGAGFEYGLFGYKKDYSEAFRLYLLSSQLNNSFGTYKLAQCFEKGKGISRHAAKALYFYRCAAKLGLTDALHTYGLLLARGGLGSDVDEKSGLHFLSLASIQSDKIYPYAQFDIGKWYETIQDTLDVCVDEEYAFEIYMKGAKLDDPNCQYRIATCYENGDLKTAKNFESAVFWYHRAAEGGHLDAQLILANFYYSGIGYIVKRDQKKAYFWTLEAGTRGCTHALMNLGEYTRTGMGVKSDILQSLWWYKISATMGSQEAALKYEETLAEVERIDDGPEIPKTCCSIIC